MVGALTLGQSRELCILSLAMCVCIALESRIRGLCGDSVNGCVCVYLAKGVCPVFECVEWILHCCI